MSINGDRRSNGMAGMAAAYSHVKDVCFAKRSEVQRDDEFADTWTDPARRLSTRPR